MGKASDRRLTGQVEEAFYQKAVGGITQREEKSTTEDDGKGGMKEKREIVIKQLPPDLDAIKAWLRERAPERWRGEGEKNSAGAGGVIRVISRVPRPGEEGES